MMRVIASVTRQAKTLATAKANPGVFAGDVRVIGFTWGCAGVPDHRAGGACICPIALATGSSRRSSAGRRPVELKAGVVRGGPARCEEVDGGSGVGDRWERVVD